jgi:hypothetical protein
VEVSDSLRAGRFGDRIPVGVRFSAPVQTCNGIALPITQPKKNCDGFEALKTTIVTPYGLVYSYHGFGNICYEYIVRVTVKRQETQFYPEDGGNSFLRDLIHLYLATRRHSPQTEILGQGNYFVVDL